VVRPHACRSRWPQCSQLAAKLAADEAATARGNRCSRPGGGAGQAAAGRADPDVLRSARPRGLRPSRLLLAANSPAGSQRPEQIDTTASSRARPGPQSRLARCGWTSRAGVSRARRWARAVRRVEPQVEASERVWVGRATHDKASGGCRVSDGGGSEMAVAGR